MINKKKVLAIIPARGGSKGIPKKNIKEMDGKPLIAWTIESAKKSKYIDRLILSSEDEEIMRVAKEWDCEVPFKRPQELARDDTPTIESILHVIDMITDFDYVVLLQPTSPLRSFEDIDNCIKMCFEKGANTCVSITESDENPYWMYMKKENEQIESLLESNITYFRRQSLPKIYKLNGAVYVAKYDWLKANQKFVAEDTIGYVMPKKRSIDIDTELDLLYLKTIIEEK